MEDAFTTPCSFTCRLDPRAFAPHVMLRPFAVLTWKGSTMKLCTPLAMGAVLWASIGGPTATLAKPANGTTRISLACSGPAASAARNIAVREKLSLGSNPKACLAIASMYGGSSKQLVIGAPSKACAPKSAIQVYEQSRAGPWANLLEKPVCGSSVSFGPNNPWGGIMITIDGRHYDQRGAYYTPANY